MSRERAYLRSHPFITFRVGWQQADPQVWMLLGEAQSKCEHIARTPLLPEVREELDKLYLTKGLSATTAIEGNTLTEEEVRRRIEGQLELPPSREYLGQEVDNIHRAVGRIPELIGEHGSTRVTPEIICEYNLLVLEGLDLPDEVQPGRVRGHEVVVGQYVLAPAQDCAFLLERLCEWINSPDEWPQGLDAISEALLKAILAHLYLAWIHPFGDGNGRTARLLEVHLLAGAGVNRSAAHLLSNHYNQTRSRYYEQLDRARRARHRGPLEFLRYALQGLVDGMKEQLSWIRAQLDILIWQQFVEARFHNLRGSVPARRRAVVLALCGRDAATAAEIRRLSPEVAGRYGDKHPRTIARDLAFLEQKNLIVKTEDGKWRPNLELLERLLPPRTVGR
ncbi:MAG: Fic family protein [Proteobacteria bacterium]|nr:Fic family protein [Pseudomonadota bacterium]